jgi:hypothetical protein
MNNTNQYTITLKTTPFSFLRRITAVKAGWEGVFMKKRINA